MKSHLQIGVHLLIDNNTKVLSKYLRFMCCTFRVMTHELNHFFMTTLLFLFRFILKEEHII